jgi:uncharacterized protein (DUF433 family)
MPLLLCNPRCAVAKRNQAFAVDDPERSGVEDESLGSLERMEMASLSGSLDGTDCGIISYGLARRKTVSPVEYAHITIGPDNVPMLAGTRIKVVEIVLDHLAYGWDARDICREFPHLSLGQVHSALGYYYDHKAEIDADIDRRRKLAEQLRERLGDGPLTEELRATGQLP